MKITIGNYDVQISTRDLSSNSNKKTRVFVSHKNTSLEGNDYRKVTKHVAKNIVTHLLTDGTVSAYGTDFKVNFQRTAGCSCGCSPGVVIDRWLRQDVHTVDIYITEK